MIKFQIAFTIGLRVARQVDRLPFKHIYNKCAHVRQLQGKFVNTHIYFHFVHDNMYPIILPAPLSTEPSIQCYIVC